MDSEESFVHRIKPGSMAADSTAAVSAKGATLLRDLNKDDVDISPFANDEEFNGDKTIINDE